MENKEEYGDDIVKYCVNCLGLYPCWCNNPSYVETWRFVYEAMMNCKPTI